MFNRLGALHMTYESRGAFPSLNDVVALWYHYFTSLQVAPSEARRKTEALIAREPESRYESFLFSRFFQSCGSTPDWKP